MDATSPDRRKHRSDNPHIALTLQLDEVQVERIEALFPSPAPEG